MIGIAVTVGLYVDYTAVRRVNVADKYFLKICQIWRNAHTQ